MNKVHDTLSTPQLWDARNRHDSMPAGACIQVETLTGLQWELRGDQVNSFLQYCKRHSSIVRSPPGSVPLIVLLDETEYTWDYEVQYPTIDLSCELPYSVHEK